MANFRVRTRLTLALTLVVLPIIAFFGWAWMGVDHETWMGAIIERSVSG
jgi:hypothetical protein